MAQKSSIDFCVVSSNSFSKVLNVQEKRRAELSSDHRLVVCSLRISKLFPIENRLGSVWLTGSYGRPYQTKCEEIISFKHGIKV